jgi:GDP-6-deoxy-D-talose 4-dehydrogenase
MATKMRALVTGLLGFTGRYVAVELEQAGYEVFGIGDHAAETVPRYWKVDLKDFHKLKRVIAEVQPNVVIHLAAIAFLGHFDPREFYHVNLMGTRNLLEALANDGGPKECVLLASSANVYGNTKGGVLAEDSPKEPANDYAVSKLAMEYMARLWMDRLPIVITRPFNYTGVGQSEDFLLPKIVSHFRRHSDVIELGNLDVWRDFSDVRAVAVAYRRLLEVKPAGETVNICSGVPHSLREVFDIAKTITKQEIAVRVNPAYVRDNDVKFLCGDPARLRSLIGNWQTPPLEETLRWMLSSTECE